MGLVEKRGELWFFEDLYSDVTYGFKVSRVIVPETDTGFQKLMILETDRFGRVLVLDGIVQLTEEDEGIYHEWIAHWPLCALARRGRRVLIIGGGDGGVAREVLRHSYLSEVTMVEIDRMVVDLCRTHMPAVSGGAFDDPRLRLIIGDGAECIRAARDTYDVVIIDSTDPIGPAKSLFDTRFYQSVYDALADGGIAIHQTGALILQPYECPGSWRQMERIFDEVRVVQFANVSYMGGPFSLTAGSKGKGVLRYAERRARRTFKEIGLKTQWYSPAITALPYPEFQSRLERNKYGEEIVMDIELRAERPPGLAAVRQWTQETCEAIKMKPFGEPMVSDPGFGEGDTLVQYIETSAINYRRYGRTGCANCFTCASLPVEDVVGFSLEYFDAAGAVCWYLPRGSFEDIRSIRRQSRIFKALRPSGQQRLQMGSKVYRPHLCQTSEVFRPDFELPIGQGFSSAFELVLDIYNCDYERISSAGEVAVWAAERFCTITGLKPVGAAHAPDFGHAKKKTAGPSVTQLLEKGSNISHYSVNWLLILVNIVCQCGFDLEGVIRDTIEYFKGSYAVGWILPRAVASLNIKEIAAHTYIFEVGSR